MKNIISDATVVDVRTTQEFKQGHFPHAINIPVDEIQKRITEFSQMKSPLMLYCRSGSRSEMAVSILKKHGIQQVRNGGGLDELLKKTQLSAVR